MFVQVIQGKVTDVEEVRALMDSWLTELAPGSIGWLGSTMGVTEEGQFIALARFESEDAARQNAGRPEQDAWWQQAAKLFAGEPEFHDSTAVDVDITGDPDQAGFVQVMQGRTSDPKRARALMDNDTIDWEAFRPEILGTINVNHDADAWTMAIYFTSEEAARAGEQKEPPPEVAAMMEELNSLSVGEPTYFDLRDPWLRSPG
ncbi:hypothetical protein [Nocardioides sp.]|uniref:hypothetical protein n=1 Tax=Nocardioides sp. TaxID=35761 RepID=UPI002ED56D77